MKTWVAIAIFALLIFGLEALQKDLTEVYKCGHQTPKTCSSKNPGDRKVCKDGYECCTCAPCKRSDFCAKAGKCGRPIPETCFMNPTVVPPTDLKKEGEECGNFCGKSYGTCHEGLFCAKMFGPACASGVCRNDPTVLSDWECGMGMGCSSKDPKNRQICKTGEVCCSCCSKEKVQMCCKRPDFCAKKCPRNEYAVPEQCYMNTTLVRCEKKCPVGRYPKGSNTDPYCMEVPIEGDECCVMLACENPPMCKDEIPSGCLKGTSPKLVPHEAHQDLCNGMIELGKALGISKECMCDIEWKNIQGHHIHKDLMTCDMMTPGMVKDNCKAACDNCMIPTTPKPVCKDIWKAKKCKNQLKKCMKSKTVKKNCMKSCKICKA